MLMIDHLADECAIMRLAASGNYRILRQVDLDVRASCANDSAGVSDKVGVVVDTETTGIDPATASILELSLRRFRFDDDGVVTQIGRSYSWLEDPGCSLDPVIVRLTGLTDAMLAGQALDETLAVSLLRNEFYRRIHSISQRQAYINS